MPPHEDIMHRFWPKVDKNGPVQPHMDTPCWIWTASVWINAKGKDRGETDGYGRLKVRRDGKIYELGAHRIIYEYTNNSIVPPDLLICHNCDVKRCVNPDHLKLDTHIGNMRDMVERNRQALGEYNGSSTLTNEEVLEILDLIDKGLPHTYIALEYDVAPSVISSIRTGRQWSSVTGIEFSYPGTAGENNGRAILNEEDVKSIKRSLAIGERGIITELANEYGVTPTTISGIKHGRLWKNVRVSE